MSGIRAVAVPLSIAEGSGVYLGQDFVAAQSFGCSNALETIGQPVGFLIEPDSDGRKVRPGPHQFRILIDDYGVQLRTTLCLAVSANEFNINQPNIWFNLIGRVAHQIAPRATQSSSPCTKRTAGLHEFDMPLECLRFARECQKSEPALGL
jgi:hypothetical protein